MVMGQVLDLLQEKSNQAAQKISPKEKFSRGDYHQYVQLDLSAQCNFQILYILLHQLQIGHTAIKFILCHIVAGME